VIATEPLPHRLAAAPGHGADVVATPAQADAAWWADVAGRGVDVAFEVAGTDEAVEAALIAVRPGGRVVLVGIPGGDRTSFPASLARRKGVTIALSRRMNNVYPRAIRLVEQGRVDVSSLVTDRFPLRQAGKAFDSAVERTGLKVVVEPTPP
jgi:L-iditol 2-dehydrogenase